MALQHFLLKGKGETFYQYNMRSWGGGVYKTIFSIVSACVGPIIVLVEISRPQSLAV